MLIQEIREGAKENTREWRKPRHSSEPITDEKDSTDTIHHGIKVMHLLITSTRFGSRDHQHPQETIISVSHTSDVTFISKSGHQKIPRNPHHITINHRKLISSTVPGNLVNHGSHSLSQHHLLSHCITQLCVRGLPRQPH